MLRRSGTDRRGSTSVSIIMACHNRAYDMHRILQAYDQQTTDEPFELIAVDDASTDGTYGALAAYQPARYQLHTARLEVNSGPSVARNLGISQAVSPLILFVGDDGYPEPDFVAEHLRLHQKYSAAGQAILGRVVWPDDMPRNTLMAHIDGVGAQQFSYYYMRDGQEYDFRHMYTANVSVKRELLDSVDHWFDPELRAFEDGELAYRLVPHGLKIIYSSKPIARHYHYQTIWSFAERHCWCATWLPIFNRKHPAARVLLGRMPAILARGWRPAVWAARWAARLKPAIRGAHCWLEDTALVLASYYEWLPNPLLDRLYIGILRYYWRKGMIDGAISRPEQAAWLHSLHAGYALAPLVSWFIHAAKEEEIPLPYGFDYPLPQRLKQVSLR